MALLSMLPAGAQQQSPVRKADDDVKEARLREAAGLKPNENLLFNGWGVTPAGEHVPISDLALKLVVSPDKKMLLAASAGFNDTGLSLLDIASRKVTQFLPLQRIWNGLAFSLDGKRIFVSGGDSGQVHVFKYADGKATPAGSVKPSPGAATVFLAGMAVHPATGKVYVCNEANDEIQKALSAEKANDFRSAADFSTLPRLPGPLTNRVASMRKIAGRDARV